MKKIYLTVTNDLTYDQRMIRICSSLAGHGYDVTLVGRIMRGSIPLSNQPYHQKRLNCFFTKGIFFYAEFNIRLLIFLLSQKIHILCAIDLDTILPCFLCSHIKRIPRVYDAHELFCEMKEIVSRPRVYKAWKAIEKFTLPLFPLGYTVNHPIASEFGKMYGVQYDVIRSITVLNRTQIPLKPFKYILYQGSVNEGRSFETLIPAMKMVTCPLWICGEGNFLAQTRELVEKEKLTKKVVFKGKIPPTLLADYTINASIGITLFDRDGLSNYLSLANRFFDYMHAGVPQVCVNYPAYKQINNKYEIAVLIDDLSAESIAASCNRLLHDAVLYQRLQANCMRAREEFNWQNEEKKLIAFYKKIC